MTVEIEPCGHCGFPVPAGASKCTNCRKRKAATTSDSIRFVITLGVIAIAANYAYKHRERIGEFVKHVVAMIKKESPPAELVITSERTDLADPRAAGNAVKGWLRGDHGGGRAGDSMAMSYTSELSRGGTTYLPADLQNITFTDDDALQGLGRADRSAYPFKGVMRKNGKSYAITGTLTQRTDVEPPVPFVVTLSSCAELRKSKRR